MNLQDPETGGGGSSPKKNASTTSSSSSPENTNPAMHAINKLRNVFNFYGSIEENSNDASVDDKDDTIQPTKGRVGQNLLLRNVLTPEDTETNATKTKNIDKKDEMLTIIDTNNANEATALFGTVSRGIATGGSDGEGENAKINPNLYKPHRPLHNPILYIFNLLQGITALASFGLILTQLLIPCLIIHPFRDIVKRIGPVSVALKCYVALFCILFILVETNVPMPFIRNATLLQGFSSRGFLYSFIGLICVQQAKTDRMKDIIQQKNANSIASGGDDVDWISIYMEVSSWLMLGIGLFYMILGLLCLKGLRDALREKEIQEWRNYRIQLRQWNELRKQ